MPSPSRNDEWPFQGKTALVTGASQGLGRAIAFALGRRGATLALTCHTRFDLLQEVASLLASEGCRTTLHTGDLASRPERRRLVEEIQKHHEGLDYLIANAGEVIHRLLFRTDSASWDRMIELHLTAHVELVRAFLPSLLERGGHILFISSHVGSFGKVGLAAYGAAKAALLGLARSLAREGASSGLRVNVVAPGYMPTAMGRAGGEAVMEEARRTNLLQRLSDPEEVALFIAHLLTMKGVSGQIFHLDSRIESA